MMDEVDLNKLGANAYSETEHSIHSNALVGKILIDVINDLGYQITKKPEAWNGEGVPPVGTECEFKEKDDNIKWAVGVVKYVSQHKIVVAKLDDVGTEFVYYPIFVDFRPIRTEEEKLIEQAHCILDNFRNTDAYTAAVILIEAGWRPNGSQTD